MDLHILLLLTVIATIMVAVGLTGMFFSVTARLNKIEKDMRRCKSDNKTHGREIRVLKERAAQASKRGSLDLLRPALGLTIIKSFRFDIKFLRDEKPKTWKVKKGG